MNEHDSTGTLAGALPSAPADSPPPATGAGAAGSSGALVTGDGASGTGGNSGAGADAPSSAGGPHPAPRVVLNATTNTPNYAEFCNKLGILHYDPASQTFWSKFWRRTVGTPLEPGTLNEAPRTLKTAPILEPVKNGYYKEILDAQRHHKYQYWLVASVINILYLTQIVIGATATALGSVEMTSRPSQKRTTAITILTAIGTVIAGILAFFKSRGQPNRARQFRNDLRRVCQYVRFMEMEFRSPACAKDVEAALKEVNDLYKLALANAETNYPDTWSPSKDPPEAK
jgi:hypothetical protein